MPIHDWTRVGAGIFHHFHQNWITFLAGHLNAGRLPPGYFALAEQVVGGPIPDVLALQLSPPPTPKTERNGGVALATAAPKTRFVFHTIPERYAQKANRVVVRHPSGQVVAVIEIVSPGNKASQYAARTFIEKARDLIIAGVHLLVVDLFPPTPRDPQGISKAIWDQIHEEPFELPPDKPLTLGSYSAGGELSAYIEAVAVGDLLPDMPLFLNEQGHIPLALEATYQTTWSVFPTELKPALETG